MTGTLPKPFCLSFSIVSLRVQDCDFGDNRIFGNLGNFEGFRQVIASKQLT